jgi:coenzyme PQQ precursor peptide PqqA
MVWSTPEVREVCVGMEVTELPVRGDVISHAARLKAGGVNRSSGR